MAIQPTNQTKVSIIAAVCLLGLVVTLKNILQVSAEVLSRDVVLYILIYSTFGILYPSPSAESKQARFDKPLYWALLIVLVTLAIIVVYAI